MSLDYREVERDLDKLRADVAAITNKPELGAEDRDLAQRKMGEADGLEKLARELRDKVIEDTHISAERGRPVGEVTEDLKGDMRHFIKTGEQRASLVAGTDANGGFLVPEPLHLELVQKLCEISPVRQYATNYEMAGDTTMYIPVQAALSTAAGVVVETTVRPETNSATFSNATLVAYEQYAFPFATQGFLDTVVGAEAWLNGEIVNIMAQKEGAYFTTGTGNGQPQGFVTGISTHTASGASTAAAAATVISMLYTLKSKFARNAKLYMNRTTLGVLVGLAHPATTNGQPLVVVGQDGVHRIQGYEVVEMPDMADIGAGAFPIWFGDMAQAYAVGTHKNLSILRDPFSNKPYVGFYALMRTGGCVKDTQAAVKYEIAAS